MGDATVGGPITEHEGTEGTLVGIVRQVEGQSSEVAVLSDVRLSIDGEEEQRVKVLPAFELDTSEGERVAVDPERGELLPQREVEGRFGDLLGDPLAQAVLDVAPGDHVRVALRGAIVHAGDRVGIEGTIRTGAEKPTRITARTLAVGPEAEALLHAAAIARTEALAAKPEPKPEAKAKPEPTPSSMMPSLGLAVVLAAAGICTLGASAGLEPYQTATRLCGLTLAALGVFVWRRRRWLPSLEPLGPPASGSGLHWRVVLWVGLGATVLVFGGGAAAFGAVSTSTNSTDLFIGSVGPFVLASFPLVLFGALVHRDGSSMRRALLMLRAKPLKADAPSGTFGALQGTSDESIQVVWSYASTTTESRTERRAADGTIEVSDSTSTSFSWERTTSRTRRCTVSSGQDLIEVDLDGALFGADRRTLVFPSKTQYLPGGYRTSSGSSETVAHATLTESMESGDSLFLVGRLKRQGDRMQLAAAGEESLFAFSAPTNARAVLRSHVTAHATGLGSLIALAAAGFAVLLG